ncbi:MAG: glycosyltransferase [Armatimonas sp.]
MMVVHDDHWFLDAAIASLKGRVPAYVFINKVPFFGEPGDWAKVSEAAKKAGATVVLGEWQGEAGQRNGAAEHLRELGFTHAIILDGDELLDEPLLNVLLKVAEHELSERVYTYLDTYWKTPEYLIRPRERLNPCMLVDLRNTHATHLREFVGGRTMILGPEHGVMHHLSWCGPEERIRRKLASWGHAQEVIPGWYNQVWRAWDKNHLMREFHPTHPHAYGFAEKIVPPRLIQDLLGDHISEALPALSVPESLAWPSVSVVIPLWGGETDIRLCLESLEPLHAGGLLHEVLVVDNDSPDEAASVAESFPFVMLHRNPGNRGFAAACNQGAALATAELLLFLNSDTIVPQAGWIRLVEGLLGSHVIGAAGPYSNYVRPPQQIGATYTRLENINLFAEEFARREAADVDVDMLVGFCFLIRKTAWEEVGGFDERFGLGTFEDNDLSYKLRRKGYRLVIPGRSFVHHSGSKTFQRMNIDTERLLQENYRRFHEKWKEDLASGFASHLSGDKEERIVFQGSA